MFGGLLLLLEGYEAVKEETLLSITWMYRIEPPRGLSMLPR